MKTLDKILIYMLLITGVFPLYNSFIPSWFEKLDQLFHFNSGMNAIDFVLLTMFAITISRYLKGYYRRINKIGIGLYLGLFGLLLLFEIVRNLSVYGLSAPGEFRFRYLIMVLPVYIALNFKTENSRIWLIRFMLKAFYYFPLLYIPVIGVMKGWSFGEEHRFLNSQVYLGMIYSLTAGILLNKYDIIKINKKILYLSLIPFTFFFIVDSHRSAWMVFLIIVLLLVYLNEIKLNNYIRLLPGLLLIIIIIMPLMKNIGIDVTSYIERRANAYINPEEDGTSKFRLLMWELQLEKFYKNPLFGEGFGGYWEVVFPNGEKINISPHSYYVQTLVKLGIVGMLLYLIIAFNLFSLMKRQLRNCKRNKEKPFLVLGFITLIAMHFYYIVYSLEYFSLITVGLALSNLLYKEGYGENNLHSNSGIQS